MSNDLQPITTKDWLYKQSTIDDNAYNCSSLAMQNISVLNVPPNTFLVGSGLVKRNYSNLPIHYKKRVRYLIMRIDEWQNDTVALFMNDLLVLNENFSDTGRSGSSNMCSVPSQNEYITRREVSVVDPNQTLTVEFEMMGIDSNTTRWFGLRDWLVILEMCQDCYLQSFLYEISYTVDDKVSVFMRFNKPVRAYAYNLTFRDIFKVYLQNQIYEYDLEQLSNQLFILRLNLKQEVTSITNGRLRVVCMFPTAVLTDSPQTFSSVKAENSTGSVNSYLKFLDSNHSEVQLGRFDRVTDPSAYNCRSALRVIGKIVLYGGLLSFFFGWQSIFIGALHNLQRLWLHIYIASNFLPSNFKIALSGLSIVQDLPFLPITTQSSIMSKLLPLGYVSDCPSIYTQYFRDVSFARNIYQVVLFSIFFTAFWTLLIVLFRTVRWMRSSKAWLYAYYFYISNRPYWLFDSLVYFQYVTTIYAVMAQFIDKAHLPPASNLNLAAAVITFIFGVAWPIFQAVYLKIREFDSNFSYNYA